MIPNILPESDLFATLVNGVLIRVTKNFAMDTKNEDVNVCRHGACIILENQVMLAKTVLY